MTKRIEKDLDFEINSLPTNALNIHPSRYQKVRFQWIVCSNAIIYKQIYRSLIPFGWVSRARERLCMSLHHFNLTTCWNLPFTARMCVCVDMTVTQNCQHVHFRFCIQRFNDFCFCFCFVWFQWFSFCVCVCFFRFCFDHSDNIRLDRK